MKLRYARDTAADKVTVEGTRKDWLGLLDHPELGKAAVLEIGEALHKADLPITSPQEELVLQIILPEGIFGQIRETGVSLVKEDYLDKPGIPDRRVPVFGKAKQGKRCECGCGDITAGGRFRPGHDSRLKSRLLYQLREGKKEAADELVRRNWMDEGKARKTLAASLVGQ